MNAPTDAIIEVFRSGTHQSMSGTELVFTDQDLAIAAAVYNATVDRQTAPLVLGHPPDDKPGYGIVKRLIASGSRLFAEVSNVSQSLKEWVRTGRYKKISASFLLPNSRSNPARGAYCLKHVGFLGAMAPAVKGMADPAFAEFSGGIVCFANDTHTMPADLHAATMELSEAPKGFAWHTPQLALHGRISALTEASELDYGAAASLLLKG